MKNILVFDGTPARRDMHCACIAGEGIALFLYVNGSICSYPQRHASDTRAFDLVLLHGSDQTAFVAFGCTGPVVYYGGDGGNRGGNWIPRSITADSPISKSELENFLGVFFGKDTKTVEDAVALVWKTSTDSVFALRLLCEAWLLVNLPEGEETGDIVIKAPNEPRDWFKPFAEIPSPDAAVKIARQMYDANLPAEAFLKKIALGPYTDPANVGTLPDFAADVQKLADALKSVAR